jgi:2-polyprenyl-3-methyl-5-hydroxy-6-metoxy-1,4-benzoquinol methylase
MQASKLEIAARQHEDDTREAFDSVAAEYRGPLGNNRLVQNMREELWRTVARLARPGGRLLDLGCGTGLDAVHFAREGFTVKGIDLSPAMIAETRGEAERESVGDRVTAVQMSIQELDQLKAETFDCIYSDLGALNCASDPAALARDCATLLAPGGSLVFSVIGRYCPWEMAYYALRGNFKRARVRFSGESIPVSLNGRTVWTRYYSPREFCRAFYPHFKRRSCRALNLFLPPPYLLAWYERHSGLAGTFARLDAKLGAMPGFNWAGDHFLVVMRHA